MQAPSYYRERAEHARRIAATAHQPELREMLGCIAQDYDDIAEDLETGAVEIRHSEMLPQIRHPR